MTAILSSMIIGLAGGLVSGLLGVGGGLVFVPLLFFMKGMNMHMAIGTSLAIIIPTVIVGTLRHSLSGMVDWKIAGIVAIFAMVGSLLGSALSIKLNVLLLRKIFAVFIVFVAVKLFFTK